MTAEQMAHSPGLANKDADVWAQNRTRQPHVVLLSWNDACVKRIESPAKWLWFTSTDNTSNSNQRPLSFARPQWATLRSDLWPGYAWVVFSLLLLKGINMMRFTLQLIFTYSGFFFMWETKRFVYFFKSRQRPLPILHHRTTKREFPEKSRITSSPSLTDSLLRSMSVDGPLKVTS